MGGGLDQRACPCQQASQMWPSGSTFLHTLTIAGHLRPRVIDSAPMGIRLLVQSKRAEAEQEPVRYEFDQDRIVIGREGGADVQLPDAEVSVKHASLKVRGAGYVVVDEGSTNGTRLGKERLAAGRPKLLHSGDELAIGPFRLVIEAGVAVSSPTSADRTAALARALLRRAFGAEASAQARVVVLNGPAEGEIRVIPEAPGQVVVGRGESCDLKLDDADVSREHVSLALELDGIVARDLGSKNGFAVNGRQLSERRLRHGDELLVGGTLLVLEDPAASALADVVALEDVVAPPEPEPPPEQPTADASTAADEAEPGEEKPEVATEPMLEAAPAPKPARRQASADWIIYLLAAVVLAASVASLFWLFNAN